MSNYVKATNFAVKDGLATGNPAKIIKGTEIDTEYNAIASAISSKADLNSPTFTGTPAASTASAGTSTTQIATTAFVTTAIAAATAALVPAGMIMIWSGSVGSIPSGWTLCNGSNSTPDLRDKFIIGAGNSYAVGGTGGSANAIVVSHTHTATTASDGTHNHDVVGTKSDGYTFYGADKFYTVSSGGPSSYVDTIKSTGIANAGSHTHSITVASAGSSGTNANLPPYYALCYIMKT
jgi:microcystin-dependent protein